MLQAAVCICLLYPPAAVLCVCTQTNVSTTTPAHLVNELPPELVCINQHQIPQLLVTALYNVACLQLEQGVLVGALNQCIITLATPAVGEDKQTTFSNSSK